MYRRNLQKTDSADGSRTGSHALPDHPLIFSICIDYALVNQRGIDVLWP